MPDLPDPEFARLDNLETLLSRSQHLKEEAVRRLRDAASMDAAIEKVLKESIDHAKREAKRPR